MRPEDVNFKTEKECKIDDHEILLSFNNDDMAELFFYWWQEEGILQFVAKYNKIKGEHD